MSEEEERDAAINARLDELELQVKMLIWGAFAALGVVIVVAAHRCGWPRPDILAPLVWFSAIGVIYLVFGFILNWNNYDLEQKIIVCLVLAAILGGIGATPPLCAVHP